MHNGKKSFRNSTSEIQRTSTVIIINCHEKILKSITYLVFKKWNMEVHTEIESSQSFN